MGDWPFVIAAYGVILAGTGLYVAALWRRLAGARRAEAESTATERVQQEDA